MGTLISMVSLVMVSCAGGVSVIRIERLESYGDYARCCEVQKEVWGLEDADLVPVHLLIAMQAHGGLVLAAYDGEGRMVGISLGFPALKDGRPYFYSHMTGVIGGIRYQGVGYLLKLRQREHVLGQGLDLISWTFDPLEGANAYFNFGKLGVICRTYKRNFYGEMRDALNVGLETDRFLVEWWIKRENVTSRLEGRYRSPGLKQLIESGAAIVNGTVLREDGLRAVGHYDLDRQEETLLVEIPESIQRIKAVDMALAREWRYATRAIFERYFAEGYAAVDVISELDAGIRRNYYVLRKGWP